MRTRSIPKPWHSGARVAWKDREREPEAAVLASELLAVLGQAPRQPTPLVSCRYREVGDMAGKPAAEKVVHQVQMNEAGALTQIVDERRNASERAARAGA